MTLPDRTDVTERTPPGSPPPASSGRRGPATPLLRAASQYTGVLAVLAALVVVLSLTQPQFLTAANLLNVAETNTVLLLVATGMTFVLLVGGIDLSVGAVIAFAGILTWELLEAGLPGPVAALAAVAAALAAGGVNGVLIGGVGLSFLVVTIGSASVLRGVASLRSGGQSQTVYRHPFIVDVGATEWAGVPVGVVVAGVVFATAVLVLRYTGFGRMVYAVGGGAEVARLAGISTVGVRVAVFTICAGCAGLAAIIDLGRITSASPQAGLGIELTAGAAVLLGGTSFMGGRGSLLGTLLGVVFLGVLQNGLTLAGISPFWGSITGGLVLIAAIGLDRLRGNRPGP